MRIPAVVACTLAMLIVSPPLVQACNIPIRTIGPFNVKRHDLRRPITREVDPVQWNLDGSWTSVDPQLNQMLRTRLLGTLVNVSFAAQRSLSIDALPPDTYGWKWIDDEDPTTSCDVVGQHAWESPSIRVTEGRREIRILAVSRLTPGDVTGCRMQDSSLGLPCPNLATSMIKLERPVGARTIVFERFGPGTAGRRYESSSLSSSGRT